MTVARLAQRVVTACNHAHTAMQEVRVEQEAARRLAALSFGPMYEVDGDGNQTLMNLTDPDNGLKLSVVETREWDARAKSARDEYEPRVAEALATLEEELAVFRMVSPGLTRAASRVVESSTLVAHSVGDQTALSAASDAVDQRLGELWRAANGEST